MATLDNVTDTLNTQNANQERSQAEQTAILNQLAASNAAIVAEMAKNAAAQAKRDQEAAAAAEAARKQAEVDAIDEMNRKELAEAEAEREKQAKAKEASKKGSGKPGMIGKMRDKMGMGAGSGLMGLARGGLLAGAFGTAIAAFTSGENFAKAGEIVGKIGEGAKALFEKIEFAVPSGKDIIDRMNAGFGGTLDAINAALDGDMDAFTEAAPQLGTTLAVLGGTFRNFTSSINQGLFAMRDKVANAGKGLMNKIQGDKAKSAVPQRSGMDARKVQTNMAKNLNKKQLAALAERGMKVGSDGAITDLKGKAVSVAKADAGLRGVTGRDSTTTTNKQAKADAKLAGKSKPMKGLSKTGSFIVGKLGALGKRIPILGQLLSAGTIAAIAASDDPQDVKIQKMAEALGGLGGGTLGAIAGGALGTMIFPGVGSVAGGLLGGFGGAFFGEQIAGALAKAILGKPETPEEIKEFVKGSEGQKTAANVKASSGSTGSGVSAMPPTRGSQISQGQAQLAQASAGGGGGAMVVAPSSTTNNIGGAHTVATSGLSTVDPFEAGTSA